MKLAIAGTGAMGRLTEELALRNPDIGQAAVWEPAGAETLWDLPQPDVIIDFSHPDALAHIADYAASKGGQVGVVFATTGYSPSDEERIKALSAQVPVIKSANFSYGVNAMKKILACAASLLADRGDMEIIEKHHSLKADAPSGTALMLAEACDPDRERTWLCGRQGQARRAGEIGIHSVRAGTIFGEHAVLFGLPDEVIEIRHTAFSKAIFAKGAIEAALWLAGRKPGFYSVEEVFY